MAIPANLTLVQITGKFEDVLGNPIAGQVHFTPRAPLIDVGATTILINNMVSATLDNTGAFSIYLPATDDPDGNPTGWTYFVEEAFTGGRTYDIGVPASTVGALDLSSLVPSVANAGTAALYVSVAQYNALAARETALEAAAATLDAVITSAAQRAVSPFIFAGA